MKRKTGKTRLLVLAVLSTALMAPSAFAASYYVSSTGNNGGTGSSSSPWQTLSYACSKAVSGDTITVNAGTYTDNSACTLKTGVSILGAGSSLVTINTSANPYINASSSLPVVNGSNEISGIAFVGGASGTAISSKARSNQSIHDCTFKGFGTVIDISGKQSTFSSSCTSTRPTATASYCDDNETLSVEPGSTDWATGIKIYNNTITNGKLYPNTIKDSFIHDNVIDNSTSTLSTVGNTSRWWNNVQFYNNTMKTSVNGWSTIAIEVWMVENDCKFYNNWTNGWFSILKNPNGPSTPYSWEIVNNTFASNNTGGSNPVGQAIETCYFANNVLIAGNYITNTGSNNTYNTGIGIHGKGWNKNFTVRNNVIYNIYGDGVSINSKDTSGVLFAGSNINVYNNIFDTLKNGSSQGVYIEDGAGTINGVNIKNNIFVKVGNGALIYPSGNDVQNVTFTNNIVNGGGYTYNYGTASGVANGGFTVVNSNTNVAPNFNATGNRPEPYYDPSSNAANFVDKGTNIGLPYTGSAPDIGAFEYLLTPNAPSGIGVGP